MYRKESFDYKLSKKLTKPAFAKKYLMSCVYDDGMSVMEALKHTISCMGTKEFSQISGIKSPNISRMLSEETILKINTFQKFLAPFQLDVTFGLKPIRKSRTRLRKKASKKARKKSKTRKKVAKKTRRKARR